MRTVCNRIAFITLIATFFGLTQPRPSLAGCPPMPAWQEQQPQEPDGAFLREAAQQGDAEAVARAIEAGVDVNEKTDYGTTALFFACDRGNAEVVQMLLEAGADPNVTDTFYNASPLTWAQSKRHHDVTALLIKSGVEGGDMIFIGAVSTGNVPLVKAIIEADAASERALSIASTVAAKDEIKELFADLEISEFEPEQLTPAQLEMYAGDYQGAGMKVGVSVGSGRLKLGFNNSSGASLMPLGDNRFLMGATSVDFTLNEEQTEVVELAVTMGGRRMSMEPVNKTEEATLEEEPEEEPPSEEEEEMDQPDPETESTPEAGAIAPSGSDAAVSSSNWPGFRGTGARGIADGRNPPLEWNVNKDINVLWKTPIPGLGNSCPAIWEDRIYLTTAHSEDADTDVRIGLYGDVASVEEDCVFDFIVYCIDKNSGEILWEQTANQARPAVKRHSKSSHANPTCATNGKQVVAFFGSEGLYCYSADGELKWKKDLGFLDSGWFYDPGYQWGFGSSPCIFEDRVIVQCDIQKDSFIAAFDLESGDEIWRTSRDEIPSWSSPVVHQFDDVAMVLTHGTKAARGYDAANGELLWSMAEHSEIVVPTPFVAHELIFIASGYSPVQPIIAIHNDARGEFQLAGRQMADGSQAPPNSPEIAWGQLRGGPYMPTPIVYGDYLYTCANNGLLTCFEAETGTEVYKKRMRADGGSLAFTGSPVAADGFLYFTAEDGRTLVVKAGPEFELIATNQAGGYVMSTPAISDGMFFIRTKSDLVSLGESEK